MFTTARKERFSEKNSVNVLDYGKIFGYLPPDSIKDLFTMPYPTISKMYFKLFGFPDPASHVRFPIIIKLCNPKKSDLILDVGCGLGVYPNTIAMKVGAKCIGIDLNIEYLRKASLVSDVLRLNTEFRFMDTTKLEFPSDCFDKVLCVEVLEHIPKDDRALAEIARVLKPGGLLILSVPIKSISDEEERVVFTHPKPLEHVRSGYEYRSLKVKIQKAGLTILKVEHWYRWFTKQALKVVYFFYHRKLFKSMVIVYPLLIPLECLDKLDERVTHEKGWSRDHIVIARKSLQSSN